MFLKFPMSFIILLEPKDKVVRAALFVVAPVSAGPNKAVPGAPQLVSVKNKDKIKNFLII